MHTIQEWAVQLVHYGDYLVAYGQIGQLLEDLHMRTRIGSWLDYLTPAGRES